MINYNVYRVSDADEMVRLLGEVFAHRDPPAVAVGLTATEFQSFVTLLCETAPAEGLSIVARAAETGEIVGAFANTGLVDSPSPGSGTPEPQV